MSGSTRKHSPARPGRPANQKPATAEQQYNAPRSASASLASRYGLNEENLAERRFFLRLGEAERQAMESMIDWIRENAPHMAREFYDWQFGFEPTRRFFEEHSQSSGVEFADLRKHLEAAQTRYLIHVFEGARTNWGVDYLEARLKVGKVHDQINLPLKWYLGSYAEHQTLIGKYLRKSVKNQAKVALIESTISKVFNLDMQAVVDSFLLNTLESMGLDLNSIESTGDKTENLADMKRAISLLVAQAEALAEDRLNDGVLANDSSRVGKLGVAFMKAKRTLGRFAEDAAAISKGDLAAVEHLNSATDLGVLGSSMKSLLDSQRAIAAVSRSLAEGDLSINVETRSENDEVLQHVQTMVQCIKNLIYELQHVSELHSKGEIDELIDSNKFKGVYRDMAAGVNEMAQGHIEVSRMALGCLAEFGKGNFNAPMQQLTGKRVFINQTIEEIRANLRRLITDVDGLVDAAVQGRLSYRADASAHSGDFRRIVDGINQTLHAVVEPMREASKVLATIASGDVTARVHGEYRGDHAQLKQDINGMAEDLHRNLTRIFENAQALTNSAEEMTAVSQQMAATAEETAAQATMVSSASEEVSKNVGMVAVGSEQMQTSIREIAMNSHEAARVARDAVGVAQSTTEVINKLGESSREIGTVIKVINSIAQQTNLLALNATIEAARAGESGRGFAVVAKEVKELAKQTSNATSEVSRRIEAIQADAQGAVQAITGIASVINKIDDTSNSIASAVEEQTATTNEIGRSMKEAASGTGEIARNISGVAVAATDTTRGATDTQKAATELAKMATELQHIVAKYKL